MGVSCQLPCLTASECIDHRVAAGHALSEADAARLAGLRARLQAHLQGSALVDGPALLAQLAGSALWEERVLLYSKVRPLGVVKLLTNC